MQASANPYRSCLFPRSKREKIPSRGLYQRFIIMLLALQLSSMTRRALAKPLATKFNLSQRSAYEHVSTELEKCLVPDGIVEKAGSVPAVRGPKIYQVDGIPCYRLTSLGILIASCLDEVSLDDRKRLLTNFLISKSGSGNLIADYKLRRELLFHLKKYPEFTLGLVRDSVHRFLDGQLSHPLDSIPRS
jgi:hypothetical protein